MTDQIIDDWFHLNNNLLSNPNSGVQPTSLRDICFIHAETRGELTPEEANRLEQGAMISLRQAWLSHREGLNLWQSRR